MQREPLETVLLVKYFRRPAVLPRCRFGLAQHGPDVNPLAVIAAVVFAKLLHTETFTQTRPDAKEISPRCKDVSS